MENIAPTKEFSSIPGPKAAPILGNILDMRQGEVFKIMVDMHKKYGDLFLLELPKNSYVYAIAGPDSVQHVLQMNNQNYIKGDRIQITAPLIGNGLFASEGAFWRRQRRMMQPAFHRREIARLAHIMVEVIQETMAGWEPCIDLGERLDMQHEMMKLTMEVVTRTLFTNSLAPAEVAEMGRQITFLLDVITERGQVPIRLGEKLPTARNRRFDAGVAAINAIVYRLIEARRAGGDPGDDLLGMLLTAQDEETGERMTDEQLRDELVTMFLAGHETTAIALSWSILLLSLNPAARRKLQDEVDTVLDGRAPGPEDYSSLPYTAAVIQEAMRLYPPLPITIRQALNDDVLDGYPVRAGSSIFVNFYALHHNPDVWDNPEGFEPERFLPGRDAGRHRYAYAPFGGGPRQCIGNNFALMEGVLALAMISQRYELNLCPGVDIRPHMPGTLRPRGGVPVIVKRRQTGE
jgi:cytochrome P450